MTSVQARRLTWGLSGLGLALAYAPVLAQATQTLAASPVTDASGPRGELGWSLILAAATSEFIEWMKGTTWFPWITAESEKLNRRMAILVSFATGLGLSFRYDPATHEFIVGGLVWSAIKHGLAQFVQTQAYFRVVVNRSIAGTTPPLAIVQGQQAAKVLGTGTGAS